MADMVADRGAGNGAAAGVEKDHHPERLQKNSTAGVQSWCRPLLMTGVTSTSLPTSMAAPRA